LPRLFEVDGLRIAINDQEAAVRGDREPPTTIHGERLPFGWVEAIPGASFGVAEAETLAIVGESSSGKSLMLLGAFGLLPNGTRALGGAVTYRGTLFEPAGHRDEPTQPIRRKEKRRFERSEEIRERVMDALGEVHLPKSKRLFGAFSSELSRGMGQRAMLAAALVKTPRMLVADEPLSGLDVSVAAAILDLLKDLKERRNMAMIIVTHDLAVVSRVAVVYAGRVIEEGAVSSVFKRPRHPYTSGLLGSLPALTTGRLRPIPGEQRPLAAIPVGRCVFADRCEFVNDACLASEPDLHAAGTGSVACHRAAELELPGIG